MRRGSESEPDAMGKKKRQMGDGGGAVEGSTRTRRICVSAKRPVEEDSLLRMDRAVTIHDDA